MRDKILKSKNGVKVCADRFPASIDKDGNIKRKKQSNEDILKKMEKKR